MLFVVSIDTYNFGSVDSIGVTIFCIGEKRHSVPHARFLMHGVRFNFYGNNTFDEAQYVKYQEDAERLSEDRELQEGLF